jgi:AraC-like DNA-binding protein
MSSNRQHAIYPTAELYLINRFSREKGLAASQWLMGTGINEEQLKRPDLLVSLGQFDSIYRNIYRLLPNSGLELGKALNLSRWGLISNALVCSQTLGQAMQTASEYRSLLRSRFNLIPQLKGDLYHIDIQRREDIAYPVNAVYAYEIMLASFKVQFSLLTMKNFSFHALEFPYSKPNNSDDYQRLFNCPISFGCEHGKILISKEIMHQSLPLANSISRQQTLNSCSLELERVSNSFQQDISWRVKSELAQLDIHNSPLDTVALMMNISSRTLRRKLQLVGTSFRQIKQDYILQMAMELLPSGQKSIQAIAVMCGFNDSANFREYFKKNTGMTPRQYRHKLLKNDKLILNMTDTVDKVSSSLDTH